MGPARAPAVGAPAVDPVRAAPGGVLDDLNLVPGGDLLTVLGVVGEPGGAGRLDEVEGVGERHVAVPVVVTVGLPVGGDVDELRPWTGRRIPGEGSEQSAGERL